jgi:hypothetical protein
MGGVEIDDRKRPEPVAKSNHSSGSATATVPTPLVKSDRFWSPAVWDHHEREAKDQPRHSVTPPVGMAERSIVQPMGGAGDQTAAPASGSSVFGPRGAALNPSEKSVVV